MSVLTKIRNRTGVLLAVVAGGIGLFIIQDGLSSVMKAQGDTRVVGEVAGELIAPQLFENSYKRIIAQYEQNNRGQAASEFQRNAARDQAWSEIIFNTAYQTEFEELGIEVTSGKNGERVDMVQGNTLHEYVLQQFKDSTGEFSRSLVAQTLQGLGKDAESQARWEAFENAMAKDRLQKKYENLLGKSNYVTTAEAKKKYAEESARVTFDFLHVPYSQIQDSTIKFSDADLQAYFNANKANYTGVDGRTIEFITFDVKATEEDKQAIQKEIAGLTQALGTEADAEAFARLRSDKPTNARDVEKNNLPVALQLDSNLAVGNVYGPFLEGDVYNSYKVLAQKYDTIQSAQASHILFKKEDKDKAEEILAEALNGGDFAELAKTYGTDGTKDKGGDLGEFETGRMVAPFQKAVFAATKLGVIPNLVETQFGYHIIDVTKLVKTKEIKDKYTLVTLNKEVLASRQTRDNVYKEASIFSREATTMEAFKKKAEEKKLTIVTAANVKSTANRVSSLDKAREIVRWAYKDAELNQVSKNVFELNNGDTYVIAVVTNISSKDNVTFASVKEQVKKDFLNEKKGEVLIKEVEALEGTLAEKKAKLYEKSYYGAVQNTATGVNLNNPFMSAVGQDVEIVAKAFNSEVNKETGILKGDNGIFILATKEVVPAQEVGDYSSSKSQVKSTWTNDSRAIEAAIRENANVKDYRYIVY
ncbi:MAG: hypothetical protein GY827_07270 [Cytophagales bacterium]|nr:hypothetical protein [Cytophagales bacterium]